MKCSAPVLSLVAALPVVRGIAFGSPTQTAERALVSILLKPTTPPSIEELRKRQTNLDPETCGWVDGVYSLGVTCPGSRTCMLYTSGAGMAGCCDGTNTIDCGWATSCIDASAYKTSGCGSSCLLNSYVRKCTEASIPYCVTWSYPSDGILDYGCGANSDSSVSTILQRATDAFGATTSMSLPTVSANPAITDINSGGTTRKTTKKMAIGLIIGIVIVALFVLFCIAIGILFCLKKKKKQRQIAASTQAMAAVHATRPQSQYPPPQQTYQHPVPQQQQVTTQTQSYQPSLFRPPIDPQSPPAASTTPSYFPHGQEEKPNAYASVHEYASTPVSPPISSPSTPAPMYAQPYGMPPPVPVVSQYQATNQAHEVDAVSVPHAPNQVGPVHEIGSGK